MLSRSVRAAFVSLSLIVALGCGGAFADAMERGDRQAAAGDWDGAAKAYAYAVQIDPDDEEAKTKLKSAKREQARERVEKAQALMRAGRAREAMQPFFEAKKIDPSNQEAQRGYTEAKTKVLADAEAALASGKLKEGFELARHVLLIEPDDEKARAIEAEAKTKIADAAVARAKEHEKRGALALALVDYGEAVRYVPAHVEGSGRLRDVRATLRNQITYWVALKNFDGEKQADDLGADVNADVLGRHIDPTLPLRIVSVMPVEKDKSVKLQGMRLGGMFRGYKFERTSSRADRSCEYVCGKETKPNPAYATAEAEMRTAQSALGAAEGRVSAAKAALPAAERTRDAARQRSDAAAQELSRAEGELSQCKSSAGNQSGACSSQQQRRDRAKADAESAKDDFDAAERAVSDAKRESSDAESDLTFKRMDADNKKRAFQSTPTTIEVDKICPHKWSVETVHVGGSVECVLRGESLYDTSVVLNRSVNGKFGAHDETFPAQPGLCAEVAKADPLKLPSEGDVKRQVVGSAVAATSKEIVTSFKDYRKGYLDRAKQAEADGKADEAVDLYVRYLLTFGEKESDKGADTVKKKLAELRDVEKRSVDIAVSP